MILVEDLMTREVVTLNPGDDLALADTILRLGRIRHLPVTDANQKLVGLITHRDLLRVFADVGRAQGKQVLARDVMNTDLVTVTPKMALGNALSTMVHNKFGCLPVVDPAGKLVGLITEADLVKFAARFARDFDALEKHAQGK